MDIQQQFFSEVERGNLAEVIRLHEAGVDITAQENKAIISAAGRGHLDVVKYLHKNGADITAQENKAIIRAAMNVHLDIVKYLHKNGADITAQDNEPFVKAARWKNRALERWLHKNGADITARNNQAVVDAAFEGDLDELKYLHESGADITAQNNQAAIHASNGGFLEMLFFLLEKGADGSALNREKTSFKVRNLLVAYPKIEEQIAEFLRENPTYQKDAARSLFYVAAHSCYGFAEDASYAAMYNPERSASDADAMVSAMVERVEKTLKKTALDPKDHPAFMPPTPAAVMHKIGFAYPKLESAMDAVDAYMENVLLGQWAIKSGKKLEDITEQEIREKEIQLRHIAQEILYRDLGLLGIVRYSEAWHNHPLPDHMRPLLAGQWHKLIEQQTSPYEVNIGTEEEPKMERISIVALRSHQDLKDESNALDHCVGRGGYGYKCLLGETHILSVQAGGKPLATLEIKLDENNPKRLNAPQFKGKNDGSPPEEADQAWRWLEGELATGRIKLNPTPANGWGETEESKEMNRQYPAIITRMGYIPTPEHVAACHRHFTHGFNVKQEYIKSTRHEGLGAARSYALEHRFVAPAGKTIDEVRGML